MTTITLDRERDLASFTQHLGPGEPTALAVAPGRVNLIGEHTDYHDGFVLPAAIERRVRVLGRPRADDTVRIWSETFTEAAEFRLGGEFVAHAGWARRAEGIVRTVLEGAEAPHGLDLWLDADLPVGGGLSSSAASMAALGMLAAHLHGATLDRVKFARTLQSAEHEYAGLKCGIMDQLAVLLGRADHALLLDCRSLHTRPVALPPAWSLVVLDTGVKHDLASSEYNRRQAECASVLTELRAYRPAINALRDATEADLAAVASSCDPVAVRRCSHVIAENARVHRAVDALATTDAAGVGRLFAESHRSLRDDYEVSCPELDAMVECAWGAPGCIGARMTGGGFGGSTVNLVARERTEAFVKSALAAYHRATGREGRAIVTRGADGVQVGSL